METTNHLSLVSDYYTQRINNTGLHLYSISKAARTIEMDNTMAMVKE
jgi:hypothetical protein